jgi:hypothetical protein
MVLEEGQAKSYFSISTLDGISPESRKREFESLLRLKVGGLVVAVNHNDDNVRFIFASGGLLAIGPGWVKGIQWYSQGPMLDRVKAYSLDNDRRASADGYAKELAPGWFIFYEKDD